MTLRWEWGGVVVHGGRAVPSRWVAGGPQLGRKGGGGGEGVIRGVGGVGVEGWGGGSSAEVRGCGHSALS